MTAPTATFLRDLEPVLHKVDAPNTMPSTAAIGREYPELEQFVEGFLAPGLTILAASPKAGKTWLVHEFAISIAAGRNALGIIPCQTSNVLCCFLEDSEKRGITRERMLAGHDTDQGCPGIEYAWIGSKWSIDSFNWWIDHNPACRVIIVDTAERYKQAQILPDTGRVYADDYAFWGDLQRFAIERDIALTLNHHDRKPNGTSGNILDTVSGTRAITGSADHIWILDRDRETGISTLSVSGRDLDEKSVQFTRGLDRRLRVVEAPVLDTVARIDQRVKARAMHEEGVSFAKIASALGISKTSAKRFCDE